MSECWIDCLRCDRLDPNLVCVFARHVGCGRLFPIDDPAGDDQLSGLGVGAAEVLHDLGGSRVWEVDEPGRHDSFIGTACAVGFPSPGVSGKWPGAPPPMDDR